MVSSVGSEHLPYKQGVTGSNPVPPTYGKPCNCCCKAFSVLKEMKHIVYILYSISVDRYYVGRSTNLPNSLKRHNAGRVSHTKSGLPWKLVYREAFDQKSGALKRKREITSSESREVLQRQITSGRNQLGD